MASASLSPSASPSNSPSSSPSDSPSSSPSASPSNSPSRSPSASPSVSPSPIAAGEVTYTMRNRYRIGKLKMNFLQITFGSANDYYPNGGVALTAGSLGVSTVHAVIVLEDNMAGYAWQWDRSANKLRMAVSANAAVDTELDDAAVTSTSLEIMVIGK